MNYNSDKLENKQDIKTEISIDLNSLLKMDGKDVSGNNVRGTGRRKRRKYHHRGRRKKAIRAITVTAVSLLGCLFLFVTILGFRWLYVGRDKENMFQKGEVLKAVNLPESNKQIGELPQDQTAEIHEEYAISYKGDKYLYNVDLVNLLFMGIDTTNKKQADNSTVNSHQSDTLILASIDTEAMNMTFINIPRDSVTEIKMLDANMNYARSAMGPIAIQHSFGDGKKLSNELVVNAVSNLLYGIPVYQYAAINMDAIPIVNDAVGGVTVEIMEDMSKFNKKMVKDEFYTLYGTDATTYVARRDTKQEDSAINRMKRQTQYLKALFKAGKKKTKENITFPITTYMAIKESVNTNLSLDEISYLAKQVVQMDIADEKIETVPGQLRAIEENEFEGYQYPLGYVVDEDSLQDMVIRIFYKKAVPELESGT